jgi:endonuclease YncB( thermonuclease family)
MAGVIGVGVIAAGAIGGGAWLAAKGGLPVFAGGTPAPAAHVAAEPAQIAVLDGDTLRVRDTVVRLAGVAAPPRGESCRGPDGAGFDCGAAATNALAEIVRARAVDCRLAGQDPMGHNLGVCEASGTQINRALVAAGYARAAGDTGLSGDEDQARAHRRGLWAGGTAVSW